MELKAINNNVTQLKLSNKRNKNFIEQLKFIGAKSIKESRDYTYFKFEGDITKTVDMLKIANY